MTDIYVRALHATESLSRFLATRYRDDQRNRARNHMLLWDRQLEDWAMVEATTPGLSSLRPHHLERVSFGADRG